MIYFATLTFDGITKDRAAKFVNMLSAIGGTIGRSHCHLFLNLSAVDILYLIGIFF